MIIHWKQNRIFFFFLIALLFSVVISEIFADGIEENAANIGFHLLENPVNPRFIAMGSAGSASSGYGFSYYNPALPFLIAKSYLAVEYGQYPKADLKRAHLEGVVFLKEWFFGISFHTESIEDVFPVNIWGNIPGYDKPFSQQFTNISLNCGFSKWEDFAFAINLNAMQDRIEDEYAYAYTLSAGAVFIPIPDRLTFGLSLLNYGTSTPMLGSDTKKNIGDGEDIPMNSRLGITWTHALKEIPYSVALDVVYRNVRDRDRSFTRNIKDRFTMPLGLEVKPLPPLAVRMGKRFNLSTEIINFGLGVNLDLLHVDLSFVIPKLIDDNQIKWNTAVTYYLRKKEDRNKTGVQNQQKKEEASQIDTTQTEMKMESVSEQDTLYEKTDSSNATIDIMDDGKDKQDTLQIPIIELIPIDSILTDSVAIDSTDTTDASKIEDTQINPDTLTSTSDTIKSQDTLTQTGVDEQINPDTLTSTSDTIKSQDTLTQTDVDEQINQDSTKSTTTTVIESREIILESVDYTDSKDTIEITDSISRQKHKQNSFGINNSETPEIPLQSDDTEKD